MLQERNVTNAGEKIGLSQSATSHALSRSRQVFNDPLLVWSKKGSCDHDPLHIWLRELIAFQTQHL
ncbi:LysR family transcriptional regulator [uncultured Nostoc sp.]|uniref:LysR family transcriptional regulator n=1 Tax=uncultured Nostoc sp. TaxID=340711 RepID=UPI0035CAF782